MVYDRRNNPVSSTTTVNITAIGDITINGNKNTSVSTDEDGVGSFTIDSGKIGGNHYLYAEIANKNINEQLRDTQTVTTLAPQRKSSNLNAMYLLLAGNDR